MIRTLTQLLSIPFLVALFTIHSFAQQNPADIVLQALSKNEYTPNPASRSCGMNDQMEKLLKDPELQTEFREKLSRLGMSGGPRAVCSSPVKVPVAIHFVGLSSPNASCLQSLAIGQINALNKDFQGTNTDITLWSGSASAYFPGVSNGNACLQFEIASRNHPSGTGLSDGQLAITINQVSGDFSSTWANYLNIFVIKNTGYLGYSPLGGRGNGDGVVIDAAAFGIGGNCGEVYSTNPYNKGRTLTHELGHYFLLDHIWGYGSSCTDSDNVADTPNQYAEYYGCPALGTSSCGSVDMHMNYMDYTNDACMYMFSAGQVTRMQNYVSSYLGRITSNASNVLSTGGSTPTCNDGIQNQGETGIDCGGPCTACATCNDGIRNQGETGIDCGGPCTACATCNDGIRNQGETGVDCGGPCTACETCNDGIQNQGETGVDCGGPCDACGTCDDNIQNQGETGVDCGGPCEPCPTCDDEIQNQGETGVDCGGPCEPCPTCDDEIQNQGETGVDCGGPCEPCPTCDDEIQNQGEEGIDCGGPCDTVCPTCDDQILNGNEVGIDCGGDCEACPSCKIPGGLYADEIGSGRVTLNWSSVENVINYNVQIRLVGQENWYDFITKDSKISIRGLPFNTNLEWQVMADCEKLDSKWSQLCFFNSSNPNSSYCNEAPVEPSCDDNIQNQGETGVDCGGPCNACPTCDDEIQNGDETGVDCGGSCEPCPSCDDNIQNQGEEGIDCGGPCNACPTCDDAIQNGNETGIDCGGDCLPCPTCIPPVGLFVDDFSRSGIRLNWAKVDSADKYIVEIRLQTNESIWYSREINIENISFRGLSSNTVYEWRVAAACGDEQSDWSEICSFNSSDDTTGDCRTTEEIPTCDDNIQNGDETGVDCGGSCAPCAVEPTCDDNIQNGDETGVDCGGSCAPCEVEPTCDDNIQNGDETGVDCGGSCAPCEVEPTCDDNIQNGDETGVDCGGSCAPCAVEPTCDDNIQNGDETGVDCGGSCAPCSSCPIPTGLYADNFTRISATLHWDEVSGADYYSLQVRVAGTERWFETNSQTNSWNLRGVSRRSDYEWRVSASCDGEDSSWSAICTFNINDPESGQCSDSNGGPTCDDNIQNGDETGVDCGGSCVPCETAPTCDDNIQNGDETGVDCGGSCGPCETAPTCDDNIQNGDETGVDCGGSCAPCEVEPTCDDNIQNGDETGVDCGGSCVPCETAPTCDDNIQNGDETGVDCGGSCAPCEETACPTPANLSQTALGTVAAILRWDGSTEADGYELEIRIQGEENWTVYNTARTLYLLSRLQRGSTYEWKIRAICGEENSAWTVIHTFVAGQSGTTTSGRMMALEQPESFTLYPNPASRLVIVELPPAERSDGQIELIDLTGKVVFKQKVDAGRGKIQVDVSELPKGLYFVKYENGGKPELKRLVIQ